ncbi:MAG: PH domain-containing protein, partial [Rubrobacter sp.]|nr:PH domain-containing protein [Rubrobacter sp.]
MNSEKRLHPVAMLIGAIKTIRRWISGLVFPGMALLISQGFSLRTVTLFLLGIIVVAALAALWGFLSWRATTYAVTDNSFRLRQGVIQKSERTIPLEHVQSVDTVQGIIQRFFGVYEVRVETAGGGASEPDASLSALDRAAAQALRSEIEGSGTERSEETTGPTILRQLSARELLFAGATSGQIGVAFSLLAVGSQFLDDFLSDDFVRRLVETLMPNWFMVFLILIPAGLLVAWLLAIAGTVLAYNGFTLSREGNFLYIKRGLLERREATIPLSRIQAIRISEGILRQPFGLAALRVESAGYGENAGVSTMLFPLLPR